MLTVVLDDHPPKRVVELTERQLRAARRSAGPSKDAIASRRRPRGWPKASSLRRSAVRRRVFRLDIRGRAGRRPHRRPGAARRSIRQSDHEHRSPDVRQARRRLLDLRVGGHAVRASCRPTPTRRRRGLRAVRQHRPSRSRRQRRQRRRRLDLGRGAPCTSRGARDRMPGFAPWSAGSGRPGGPGRSRRPGRRPDLRDLPTMIDFTLTDEHRLLEQSIREWGAQRGRAVHPRRRSPAPLRSRSRAGRHGEAGTARHLGAAGIRRRRHGLHRARPRQRGARVPRHVAARDHVGARRPELPDAADVGQRGSEAALSRAAGAGQQDLRLRPDRAARRQRRARASRRRRSRRAIDTS